MMLSVAGSLAAGRGGLIDRNAGAKRAERALAFRFLTYGLPIVLANFLYQTVPLANRVIVSQTLGFAEAGQLSLAFEIGIRVVGAIGSALDVILFQIAVLTEKTAGADEARMQISRNMGVVFAIVLPSVVGCWLILPSFEALFVPETFRGPFAHYFTLTAPALLGFALMNYGVHPAFQIAHRLAPLIIAALVASLANSLAVIFLPASADASKFAIAQSISTCSGLAALIVMMFALEPMWPRARDRVGALAASALMLGASLPLRSFAPGAITLAGQLVAGVLVYGAAAFAFDVAKSRSVIAPKLAARMKRA
jgi:O-antigen/teichoic acid export membrane protein